jgi:hypothetical protein
MTALTPDQIQQARNEAQYLVKLSTTSDMAVGRMARVVLALTEENKRLRQEAAFENQELFKERDAAGSIVAGLQDKLALTEQQPEPDYAHPRDGDFYTQFCYGIEAERIAADLPAAAVVGICTRIAHRVQRKLTEQQPEPVSQDELGALVIRWWRSEHPIHVLTSELLARYHVTARAAVSPEEADRG